MDKYVRKIVHLELKNNSICQLEKKLVAYYKMEKRNGRIKITLSIEGVKFLKNEPLYFCLIIKDADIYRIKKIKPILINVNRIEEVLYIDDLEIENIRGCLILDGYESPYDEKKIAFAGFQDESIDLNLLKIESYDEKSNFNKDKDSNAAKSEQVKPNEEKELSDHNEKEIPHKSALHNQQELVDNGPVNKNEKNDQKGQYAEVINSNSGKEREDAIVNTTTEQKVQAKPAISLFNNDSDSKKEKQKTEQENIDMENQNIQGETNENTIEYIKKQLELKEEIGVIDDLFNKNQKLIPFEFKEDQTEWVKIDITDLVFLPLESWMLINNAFLMACYRKYKHLILGRNPEEKVLKLGIPDIYYFKESLVANVCGFNEFYPCSGCPPKAGEYGYWIIQTNL